MDFQKIHNQVTKQTKHPSNHKQLVMLLLSVTFQVVSEKHIILREMSFLQDIVTF